MLVSYSYGIGMIYLVTFLTLSGNLQSGFVAFAADPVENYGLAFIFSLTGYCGANVVLTLVRTFGNQSLYYLYLLFRNGKKINIVHIHSTYFFLVQNLLEN